MKISQSGGWFREDSVFLPNTLRLKEEESGGVGLAIISRFVNEINLGGSKRLGGGTRESG